MAKRAQIDFSGFDDLISDIKTLGADVDAAAEEALEKAHMFITTGVAKEMRSHKVNGKPVNWQHTGETKDSLIKEPKVAWSGAVASVEVGFTGEGAAKYLIRGTPRIKPSKGLYNALYSKKTIEQAMAVEEHALEDFIARVMTKGG